MKQNILIGLAILTCLAGSAAAQEHPADPLERHLFPPELLMRHQAELRLDETQRSAIVEAMGKAQASFTALEWDLQREMHALGELLSQERVDEKIALEQLEAVLELEKQLKRTQLALVIRIKNRLSPEQQQRLGELRSRQSPRLWPGDQ